jgi:hypothetical protein
MQFSSFLPETIGRMLSQLSQSWIQGFHGILFPLQRRNGMMFLSSFKLLGLGFTVPMHCSFPPPARDKWQNVTLWRFQGDNDWMQQLTTMQVHR